MKNLFKLLGVIALIAVIGFSFAACDDENSDSDGNGNDTWGNPPAALVGTWMTLGGASPGLVINANGTGTVVDDPVTSWKVKGSELKMTYSGVESVVKWSISGNTLTLSYPDDASLLGMGSLLITLSPLTKSGNSNVTVTLIDLGADGSSTWTTTKLVLTFDKAISGLSAADIIFSGVSGISKGILSGSNPYTLPISGITSSGSLNVAVSKLGYTINGSPKTVGIFYYSGGSNNNSSVLNYIGEGPAPNYQKYRLTITDNNSFELQVGSKISSGTAAQNGSQYQWNLSPQAGAPFPVQLSSSGIVNIGGIITFNDGNYETGPGLLTPTHSGSGVFVTLIDGKDVEGGSSGGISWVVTTTELILEFNRAIPGLSASDISLSGVSGVNKGALSGSNPYTLPISGFTSSGTLNMAISKSGYDIYGSPWSVYINYVYYPVVDMVQIPGGSFEMGSDDGGYNERPVHTVTLNGFSMGRYEVTQEQWTAVMGRNPSRFQSSPASGEVQNKRPVESVSWYAALVFCNRLSMLGGLSPAYRISGSTDPAVWGTYVNESWDAVEIVAGSNGYRLPTEAQWEYAARGGNGSPGNYAYSGSDYADNVAWYNSNSGNKTHEAGKKDTNGLGLYDMSGNVWEWCWDWYDQNYYSSSLSNNPTGPTYGNERVYRGGSWNSAAYDDWDLPTRRYYEPRNSNSSIGLRIVRP